MHEIDSSATRCLILAEVGEPPALRGAGSGLQGTTIARLRLRRPQYAVCGRFGSLALAGAGCGPSYCRRVYSRPLPLAYHRISKVVSMQGWLT